MRSGVLVSQAIASGELRRRNRMPLSAKNNSSKTGGDSIRRFLSAHGLLLILAIGIIPTPVRSAIGQSAAKGQSTSEDKPLVAGDGAEIKTTYFKSTIGQEAPVVILLHGKGGSRQVWKTYAESLQKEGYAVISVDLRGHGESSGGSTRGKKGESGTPNAREYLGMINGDMEAVKKFVFSEHQKKQLNMNKIGIVAADVSTPVAICYADFDWSKPPYEDAAAVAQKTPKGQDVQALILLSPETSAAGINVSKSLTFLRNISRPVFVAVGSKNKSDLSAATKVYEHLAPKKEKYIFIKTFDTALVGTDLLGKGLKLELAMKNFLGMYVKDYQSEWRDRRSKLEIDSK